MYVRARFSAGIACFALCLATVACLPGLIPEEEESDWTPLLAALLVPGISAAAPTQDSTQTGPEYLVVSSLINGAGAGVVYLYRISADGCRLELKSSAAAGANPYDLIVSADGAFVYVANAGAASITPYRIDYATESLQALASHTVNGPTTTVPYGMTIHPNGWFYTADGASSGSVSMLQRDANTGLLSALTPNDFIAASPLMWYATLGATGDYLYVSHFNGFADAGADSVFVYSVNSATGALTFASSTPSGNQPWYVALHPTGDFLYVSNYGAASVSMYSINQTTGALSAVSAPVASGANPIGLAVGRSFVYAAANTGGTVHSYRVESSGALSQVVQVAPAGPPPYGLALNASETCLFVAQTDESGATAEDRISAYVADASGGLSFVESYLAAPGPRFLARARQSD